MWIRKIRSLGFGALHDGDTLDFDSGLNVIYGRNETGKSTWHTALMVAICGFRKKSGKPGPQQKAIERYQPWGGGAWGVAVEIGCGEDGYRIQRDLLTAHCTVSDLAFGKPFP